MPIGILMPIPVVNNIIVKNLIREPSSGYYPRSVGFWRNSSANGDTSVVLNGSTVAWDPTGSDTDITSISVDNITYYRGPVEEVGTTST